MQAYDRLAHSLASILAHELTRPITPEVTEHKESTLKRSHDCVTALTRQIKYCCTEAAILLCATSALMTGRRQPCDAHKAMRIPTAVTAAQNEVRSAE